MFKEHYLLPLISDSLEQLAKAEYFSCLDMAAGFHQIPIATESIEKLRENFWFLKMSTVVRSFVENCIICKTMKGASVKCRKISERNNISHWRSEAYNSKQGSVPAELLRLIDNENERVNSETLKNLVQSRMTEQAEKEKIRCNRGKAKVRRFEELMDVHYVNINEFEHSSDRQLASQP
ncbi:hypothetical protein RUM43_000496 [Polyplax serrata]|uniref:Integrase zinc-binding domain-containing protein n=1 Tax=Polyplax serrata TaxID=468196 RepID=A0AAN8XNP1_POLSC